MKLRNLLTLIFIGILLRTAAGSAEIDSDEALANAARLLAGAESLELVELESGSLRLDGRIERKGDLKKVEALLKHYPEIENNTKVASEVRTAMTAKVLPTAPQRVPKIEATILLEMALIEVNKSILQKLGPRFGESVNVGSTFNFALLAPGGDRLNIGSLSPIKAFLDMALQKGEAKIHAKQSLVTQNGKQGEFKAGAEFPIKVTSDRMMSVQFKPFGFFLKFIPQLSTPPTLRLFIECEISDIDFGSQVDGLPLVLKKELKTELYLKLGETTALASVIHTSDARRADHLPGFSSIPLLGRLFRSEDFKNQKSEAYLFVTPRKLEEAWLPTPPQ